MIFDEKGNDDKTSTRRRNVFKRLDYAELALDVMRADVSLIGPSSRLARRYRRLFRAPYHSLSRAREDCQGRESGSRYEMRPTWADN